MDWLASVDAYCERIGPAFWAEPLNAATNAAFLIAAAVMWGRVQGLGPAMCAVLAAIGIGSFLFHTFANRLTGLMDVLPIGVFILLYVFAASRDMLGMTGWQAGLATLAFIPYAAVVTPLFGALPFFEVSAMYWPVPVLILVYAALMAGRAPATAQGLAIGAGILIVSLAFRSLDQAVCGAFPLGTHFLWHVLNGIMLGWMIEVWRRHVTGVSPR